jgi:hypothetical protein
MVRVVAAALVAGTGLVVGLAVATSSHGAKPPARGVYLARARAICSVYSSRLDRIPPVQDPTLLGSVIESTNAALPILREQADRIRALTPPAALRARVARFFELTDRSIRALQSVLDAAKAMDVEHVSTGLIAFGKETAAAKRVGRRIGYRC